MVLRRFAVENYRAFRGLQEIELAPVTVVLGKNNSGKSALVRAPLLLASGFSATTSAPFDFDAFGIDFGDSFTDLIFEKSPHGRIDVRVDLEGFLLDAGIQYVSEDFNAHVASAQIVTADAVFSLRETETAGEYLVEQADGTRVRQRVEFRGLIPQLPELSSVPSFGTLRYLSAYRHRPARWNRLPIGGPPALGASGEGLAEILAHDKVRAEGQLIERVNGYLSGVMPDWRLDVVSVGPLYATVLSRAGGRVTVNLLDAGAGLSQALPILVQCAVDEQAGHCGWALQVIEEPETHLHPAAHAELADLYLQTSHLTGTRFLVETHSETLLLRLRRRIAEGAYPPDAVAIYVVEQVDGVSASRRVELDALGNLGDGWPDNYFTQDYQEVRAMLAAQRERDRDAAGR